MKKAGITYLKFVFPAFLLLLMAFTTSAQRLPIDSLGNQIGLYGLKTQSPLLFVHFDKNVYSNNESVWFTAYLFNADYRQYRTLSLILVKDHDRTIMMDDKFVMANGISFGNTFVPDSVGPGNYTFIATTNRLVNGKPDVVFTQPITIKAEARQGYTASLNPMDTSAMAEQQKILLLVNFNSINPTQFPATIPVSYYVGNTAHPVLQGNVKTEGGQYKFNIPSKLLSQGSNRLHVQVKYKKEYKEVSIALPVLPKSAVVKFYPEGGSLVNNIKSTLGWEVKNGGGDPIAVNAILYRDNNIIDTIETDGYGLGKFTLMPAAGSNYYVKLYRVNKKDTLYKLPAAITQGPALSIANAVVNDTLSVTIQDDQKETLYLTGHNYKQLFFTTAVNMSSPVKHIKFVLKDVPKGLTQLTLTDSIGRPFAERLFFAHHDQRTPVSIITDKNEYATREKVHVKIKLDGKVDSGFVSIACVQENRIEVKKKNDIENYFYLKHDLADISPRENYLDDTEADKNFLENVLLIKGWSRYTWTDMLKTVSADTVRQFDNVTFTGFVTMFDDKLRKPVTILNIKGLITPVVTDKTGNFKLEDGDVVTGTSNRRISFIASGKDVSYYKIHLSDPYHEVSKKLAQQFEPRDYYVQAQENTRQMQLAINEHSIKLREVKINGDGGDFRNACGDYVCRYKVLNCPNHPRESDNRPAVVGEMYYIHPVYVDGIMERYVGCKYDKAAVPFKGIYTAQEFYQADYSKENPKEPDYVSTLFWKYQLKVSSAKEAEVSFYTGDITGKFKIVVQGVAGNDVTYGESSFNVVKAK